MLPASGKAEWIYGPKVQPSLVRALRTPPYWKDVYKRQVHAVPDADLIPADVKSRIGFAEQLQAEILQIGVGQRCNSGHAGTAVIEQLFQLIHFTSVTDQDTSHHFPYQRIPCLLYTSRCV